MTTYLDMVLGRILTRDPLPFSVAPGPHQEEGAREDQAQVHRHQLQVWSRTLPDPEGQDGLHGTPQEGQGEDRIHGLKRLFVYFLV